MTALANTTKVEYNDTKENEFKESLKVKE